MLFATFLNSAGLSVTYLILNPIFDLRTHRGALTFPDQVNAYLSKEVQLGRIAGPFDKALFMQGFVLSPLDRGKAGFRGEKGYRGFELAVRSFSK